MMLVGCAIMFPVMLRLRRLLFKGDNTDFTLTVNKEQMEKLDKV